MPSPADPPNPRVQADDGFLQLLLETLESLENPARAQFLQRFFKAIAQVELSESVSSEYWERIRTRMRETSEIPGSPVSFKRAIMDVLISSESLRVPILIEYEELKKLQVNAATDPLTGLYNRRLFDEYFDKELNRSARYNHRLGLVVFDMHVFKQINDRYGHPRGDQLLRAAAQTLRESLRTSDYAFRIGGDEFALLLPQTDAEQALALARRLRAAFSEQIEPMRLGVAVGLDYGVAVYPEDGGQKESLLGVADERLYQWKTYRRPDRSVEAMRSAQTGEAMRSAQTGEPTRTAQTGEATRARPAGDQSTEPPAPPAAASAGRNVPAAPAKPVAPQDSRETIEERRKSERVALSGTTAYAQLADVADRTARVVDLSSGGVALEMARPEEVGATFSVVLHVPILPPVRVSLRRIYFRAGIGETARIGCAFVT
ncbi:MAG: diguanylate cyclase [Candidatus Acidiferrales bacterium]